MDDEIMNANMLSEIKDDLKEIKGDFNKLHIELTEIKSKMPTIDKVQGLEVKVNTLEAQFKIIWAAVGTFGIISLGSIVASLFKLLGL